MGTISRMCVLEKRERLKNRRQYSISGFWRSRGLTFRVKYIFVETVFFRRKRSVLGGNINPGSSIIIRSVRMRAPPLHSRTSSPVRVTRESTRNEDILSSQTIHRHSVGSSEGLTGKCPRRRRRPEKNDQYQSALWL